jgi:hypothetical protein
MHIVIIAWLFVTFTMALTLRGVAGAVFLLAVGVAPVALYLVLLVRRRRARRAAAPGAISGPPAASDRSGAAGDAPPTAPAGRAPRR